MEGVFRIQRKSTDLCAQLVLGDRSCLCAVSVQAQTTQLGGREINGIPFQDNAGLGGISAAEDRRRGRLGAKRVEDLGLEGVEFLVGDELGMLVSGYIDVDDTAGVDVWREEDGRELDLWGLGQ